MPSKKKKYNARFPAGRIKKIMQTDEEIGKVAQAVPVVISRTLELFVESLLKRAMEITSAKNAKTLTPTHMKQCILSESRFDFLKDLVKGIPDVSNAEDEFGTLIGGHSPGTPLSAKAYSGYSCFQFHQSASSDSSSSKSSGATSQPLPLQSIQPSQPKFYKEIPIGSEDCDNRNNEHSSVAAVCGTTVIQHTGSHSLTLNHCATSVANVKAEGNPSLRTISGQNITQLNELKLSNCIKRSGRSTTSGTDDDGDDADEDDDDDEQEVGENGYHRDDAVAKVCVVDEDYDT